MTAFRKISLEIDVNKREQSPESQKFDESNKKPRLEEYFMKLYNEK